MIIKHEISGYWNGDLVVDTEERIPKVGDSVVMNPCFRSNNLDCNTIYLIESVSYISILMGYLVTLSGHSCKFPADTLLLVTRVELDEREEPTAYVVPFTKSECCDVNVGDIVYTKVGYHLRWLADRREYIVKKVINDYIMVEGKPYLYPAWGLVKGASGSQIKKRNDACADLDINAIKSEPTLLTPTQRTNSIISSIETSRKYGYSEKEKKVVAKLTTTVVLKDGTKGSATCDAGEYDERTGVLNAIANAKCGGNFDSEYNKYCKIREKIIKTKCKCGCCGKQYWTQEDAHECRKKHIANKIRKHENYLIRREAKRRLAEEVKETAIKTAMEKIRKEEK